MGAARVGLLLFLVTCGPLILGVGVGWVWTQVLELRDLQRASPLSDVPKQG